jgi:uncharacterized YkwD family protein
MRINIKKTIWTSILCCVLAGFPLSTAWGVGVGAKGADVFAVQGMLTSTGDFKAAITGYYGAETIVAVKQFQKRYNLAATGTVNDQTMQSILWAYSQMSITQKSPIGQMPEFLPAPKSTMTPVPKTYPLTGLSAEEEQMLQLVNQARAEAGLQNLIVDSALTQTARLKSQDMVNLNYFEHQSPTYGSPLDMMNQFGITFQSAGENIACNQDVDAAEQALMNSQKHRENILNDSFTQIGIGIIKGGQCGQMFTQQFVGR